MLDFSQAIEKHKAEAFQEFIDMYILNESHESESFDISIANYFKKVFDSAVEASEDNFYLAAKALIDINIKADIPYIVLINELGFLKSKLIHIFLNMHKSEAVITLCHRFDYAENQMAQSYLEHYIKTLQSNINLRLASLSEVVDKDVINHYELHVKWLFKLSEAIRLKDSTIVPEKDPTQCHFGKWLLSDAKLLISNNSKYSKMVQLHETLHYLGKKIAYYLEHIDENFHVCISYLEKADLTSMEIGTELMLIDNKRMIACAAKDELTGVLNRSLLEQIFFNQYEIALATKNSYIFAMCDLDHFKKINDTYGHVAGDVVLKFFANLLTKSLRASDIIIRFGGEEFVMIMPALDYAKGKQILDGVCNKVNHTLVKYEAYKIHISVSIGLIEISPLMHLNQASEESLVNFLQQVDDKLYLAKHNGRNRVE
ncbi:MAG: sensor domain-containing diguanylate cyclase [Pseudomonadota bacterium]